MNREQQIKNLRLCLRIHTWVSVLIVALWVAVVVFLYVRFGKLSFPGWIYLLILPLVYYALRVKLKEAEQTNVSNARPEGGK
jgi:hypothetical protein